MQKDMHDERRRMVCFQAPKMPPQPPQPMRNPPMMPFQSPKSQPVLNPPTMPFQPPQQKPTSGAFSGPAGFFPKNHAPKTVNQIPKPAPAPMPMPMPAPVQNQMPKPAPAPMSMTMQMQLPISPGPTQVPAPISHAPMPMPMIPRSPMQMPASNLMPKMIAKTTIPKTTIPKAQGHIAAFPSVQRVMDPAGGEEM
jgi:hypothetical protein